MSDFSQQGLSIHLFKPAIATSGAVVSSYVPEAELVKSVGAEVTSYAHTLTAVGGYDSAQFSITCDRAELEWWAQVGLNLHVKVTDEAALTVWEGFVNQLGIDAGNLQIVRGPLTDVGNQLCVYYNLLDTSTRPPTSFVRRVTGPANRPASIALYGLWWKLFEASNLTSTSALALRNYLVNEWAWPRQTTGINLNQASEPTITFDCLGYVSRLSYPYNNTAVTAVGAANVSTILAAVLNADPNALFASSNADITTNTIQAKQYENDNKAAWSIIKYLVALGDASANRMLFQVGAERRVTYAPIPIVVEYHQRIQDSLQRITTVAGDEVKPWNVKAGKWLRTTDYLAGTSADQYAYLREDPRVLCIEQVQYSAPYGLVLQGGVADRSPQKLAQMGLGGMA